MFEKQRTERGFSSVGRAPALQAGGREFESRNLHDRQRKSVCTLKTEYKKKESKIEKEKFLKTSIRKSSNATTLKGQARESTG